MPVPRPPQHQNNTNRRVPPSRTTNRRVRHNLCCNATCVHADFPSSRTTPSLMLQARGRANITHMRIRKRTITKRDPGTCQAGTHFGCARLHAWAGEPCTTGRFSATMTSPSASMTTGMFKSRAACRGNGGTAGGGWRAAGGSERNPVAPEPFWPIPRHARCLDDGGRRRDSIRDAAGGPPPNGMRELALRLAVDGSKVVCLKRGRQRAGKRSHDDSTRSIA